MVGDGPFHLPPGAGTDDTSMALCLAESLIERRGFDPERPPMRLAPVPMAFADTPEVAVARAAESARTTHGLPQAIDATRYLASLTVGALAGSSKAELLPDGVPYGPAPNSGRDSASPRCARGRIGLLPGQEPTRDPWQGLFGPCLGGRAVGARFDFLVRGGRAAAVDLGDDADTTAAIYG